jgi:hypothetical protein
MIDNMGIGIYDDTAPTAIAKISGLKAVDAGMLDYAQKTYQILSLIKQEYWDAIGMNRQRQGDILASDGKANTEQAIYRSSMITEEITRRFDIVYQKDLNGLLDYTKVSWIKGKKAKFLNSERKLITLNVVGEDWINKDWGIYIGNPIEEQEKLNTLKPLALAFIQNSQEKKEIIADIIDTNNITKLKKILRNYDDNIEAKFLQQQQNEQKAMELKNKEIEELKNIENAKIESQEEIEYAKIESNENIAKDKINLEYDLANINNEDLSKQKFEYQKIKDARDFRLKEQKEQNRKKNI